MKENNEIDTREVVIRVDNVKKSFKSYKDKATSFKERFVNPSRGKHEDVMVLKGISFEVHKGEAIGIIGKNGCGKSTTLKMLTRILYPNEGKIEIKGRVSSLIELGAGFHPDMTGRENIYTNASIFGITRKEVDRRLNDIIRFSELEEYIDNPVRTYSSGMYMRLAFAVAINVDADVLLIDEILAVGDSAFQKKCFDKLKEIKANGTTIVIVSHSMDQMYKICDKLIWIENGLIKDEGTPKFIGEAYLAAMEGRRLDRIEFENQQKKEELERKPEKVQDDIQKTEVETAKNNKDMFIFIKLSGKEKESYKGIYLPIDSGTQVFIPKQLYRIDDGRLQILNSQSKSANMSEYAVDENTRTKKFMNRLTLDNFYHKYFNLYEISMEKEVIPSASY